MPDLILREVDPDKLRAAIVADVVAAIRPMIERQTSSPKRVASRAEMAEMLGWSVAKLDRCTKAKAIPSMLDGDRRSYVIDEVLEALKSQTPKAEAVAAERQAAKHARRQRAKAPRR